MKYSTQKLIIYPSKTLKKYNIVNHKCVDDQLLHFIYKTIYKMLKK